MSPTIMGREEMRERMVRTGRYLAGFLQNLSTVNISPKKAAEAQLFHCLF